MEKNSKLSIKNQKIIIWFNRLLPLISLGIGLFFLITASLFSPEKFSIFFQLNVDSETAKNLKIFTIMLSSFVIFFNLLYLISASLANYQEYQQYKMQFLFLACFGLNLFNFSLNLVVYIYDHQKSVEPKKSLKLKRQTFWKKLGFYPWKTYDVALIGIGTALTIVLAYLEQFLPHLNNGGGIALKYLPIIIIAFVHSAFGGMMVGTISALMSLIFIPGAMIISPWSFILDYFLPMISPMVAGFLKFKTKKQMNYLEYLNYVIIVVLTFILIYLWQVLAGYFIWVAIYGPGWGNNGWIYSIIYNAIHVWIFTYPIAQITIPPVLKVLAPIYQNKQNYL